MKRLMIYSLIVSLSGLMFSENSKALSASDQAKLSAIYGNNIGPVLGPYDHLFEKNTIIALNSVDALASQQAYEALAIALPSVDDSIRPAILNVLTKVKVPTPIVIQALVDELKALNARVMKQGGEDLTANRLTKRKLIMTISRGTGVDSNINSDSQQDVDRFLRAVRSDLNEPSGK